MKQFSVMLCNPFKYLKIKKKCHLNIKINSKTENRVNIHVCLQYGMTITKKQTKELDVDIHSSMPRIKRISLRTLLAASYITSNLKQTFSDFFNCLCQLNFYIKTVILPVLRL